MTDFQGVLYHRGDFLSLMGKYDMCSCFVRNWLSVCLSVIHEKGILFKTAYSGLFYERQDQVLGPGSSFLCCNAVFRLSFYDRSAPIILSDYICV